MSSSLQQDTVVVLVAIAAGALTFTAASLWSSFTRGRGSGSVDTKSTDAGKKEDKSTGEAGESCPPQPAEPAAVRPLMHPTVADGGQGMVEGGSNSTTNNNTSAPFAPPRERESSVRSSVSGSDISRRSSYQPEPLSDDPRRLELLERLQRSIKQVHTDHVAIEEGVSQLRLTEE